MRPCQELPTEGVGESQVALREIMGSVGQVRGVCVCMCISKGHVPTEVGLQPQGLIHPCIIINTIDWDPRASYRAG